MLFNLGYSLLALLSFHTYGSVALPVELETRANGIAQSTYDSLLRYAKFSSAAYQLICPYPLGTNLVRALDTENTEGFITRDDKRKEIIVSLRGTFSINDAITDLKLILTPLKSVGIADVGSAQVHTGFLEAYNYVASEVLSVVKSQLSSNPSYSVIVTGHSLGGALASLAALSIKSSVPSAKLRLYTYGQPRVGNAAFASLTESRLGIANIFRAVHTYDGVPTFLLKSLGYRHFGNEFWNYQEPPNAANVKQCNGGEDTSCSDSVPSTFINAAHIIYFDQPMALDPLLCVIDY
ncbi:hypothetical protein NMY22_g19269 [Coprinellus aureogranulatus]|nr:hypothetical protein NMY22_g19269 [Coprinellus aureogranulatus]